MTAEGGTAINHEEVIYRTKDINDQFVPYEKNPILTQKHLDPNRENPITSAGHADIVLGPDQEWYGIFLAVRPYEGDHYNTGRETFMAPVKWENDWPVFDLGGEEIKYRYPTPQGVRVNKDLFPLNGNFSFTRDFEEEKLAPHWLFLRTPKTNWYTLENGNLKMQTRPETISGTSNPSFIGHRQQHLTGSVSASFQFSAEKPNEKAGLVAFQNEDHYYFISKSFADGNPVIELYKGSGEGAQLLGSEKLPAESEDLEVKVGFDEDKYSFYYRSGNDWQPLAENLDGKYLSTRVAGGFVGVVFGLYTTSSGEESSNKAVFDWFKYAGEDAIYKEQQ